MSNAAIANIFKVAVAQFQIEAKIQISAIIIPEKSLKQKVSKNEGLFS